MGPRRQPPSFPTRRSSDLEGLRTGRRDLLPHRRESPRPGRKERSEEHTSELQSRGHLVCRLLLEKKKYPTPHRKEGGPCARAATAIESRQKQAHHAPRDAA